MYEDLKDKVVLITGGAAGLGKEAARKFLEEGSHVVIADISANALAATAQELGVGEDRMVTVIADVSKEADVKNYVDVTVEKFGRIDVFFKNAGIEGKVAPLVEQKVEDFDRVIAINVRGSWLGLHFVLPVMYEQKSGSVINTSWIGGLVSGPTPVSPYVASKFAITGITRIAAQESALYQVRVNSVHPSPADTQMMLNLEAGAGATAEELAATIPLGRYASPEDVTNLVAFLGSDQSSFVTGSEYRVDGGMLA